jgi:Predicted 3'-5' exonuclease related to the exonuclease domain of PolB
MGRDPDQEMPDPFSTATVQDPSAQPAAEAKTETAPQRCVLPKNLRNAVKHLSDGELDLMHAAILEEMGHRGRTPQGVETSLSDIVITRSPLRAAMGNGDVLSSFAPHTKASLNELSRIMGLPGKPDGMDGSEVERYFLDGKIKEIADYCESDVVNTYRVWLRYELFRGKLPDIAFQASEANLSEFIKARSNTKPHLVVLT